MSAAPIHSEGSRQVSRCLDVLGSTLDELASIDLSALGTADLTETTERLLRVDARVKSRAISAAAALEARGAARDAGATSTGAMIAATFGGDRRAGDQLVRVAKSLEQSPRTSEALARGLIAETQAAVIASAVSDLPADTTPDDRRACEDTLIGDAGCFTLRDLRSRATRITDQFKPDPEVDRFENATLVERERRAWAASEFWLVDNRDGTHRGGFVLPDAQADMLRTAIEAISAPRRDHLHDHRGSDDGSASMFDRDLAHRTRLGIGLAELCGHLPTDELPGKGGVGATLTVALDYDTLVGGVKPATLSTGTRISAGQVRQMACRLGIIPLVFNGKSLPLDHGSERRYFSAAQRRAMECRDGGCSAPGCARPPGWCEAHHAKQPFSIGKTTHLDEGVLLCAFHHRRVHDDGWAVRFSATDGHPEYRLPGSDTWQRNHRWRP